MKRIIFILTAFFTVVSCQDAIEITQAGEINDSQVAITSVKDMRTFLNGDVYPAVNPLTEIFFTSLFTDEVGFGPSSVSTEEILTHRFVLNSGSSYAAGIWTHNYNIINNVNILMKGATNVDFNTLSPSDKLIYTNVLAHARALRAYAYLNLESYFSTDMKNPNALGVILTTTPADVFQSGLARSTNAEVYALIEQDLQYALANVNIATINANVSAHHLISIPAVNAIAARYYLYKGDIPNAKLKATAAVSGLALSNTTVYPTIWTDAAKGEVIFSAARPTNVTAASNIAGLWTTNTTDFDGSVRFDMGRKLYGSLNDLNGDIRLSTFVDTSSKYEYPTSPDPRNKDVIVINKYPGKGSTALRNDIKLFRASEMYFILAECALAENNLVSAANFIRQVRQARVTVTTPPQTLVFATPQAAAAGILLERRRELAFEGHRYLDLKRLGPIANQGVDRDPYDDTLDMNQPLTLPSTDYRFTLPIPLNEINANTSVQQNPNYN